MLMAPFRVRLFFCENLVLESFSPLTSFDERELRQWQVGEVGPGRMGNVLMSLVNTHTGGPGDQVGALCPEVGSSHHPVGYSDCCLLETHLEVSSEGCWGCWRKTNETDDGLALHSDATQVPCPVGDWQGLLEPRSLHDAFVTDCPTHFCSVSLSVSTPDSAPRLGILTQVPHGWPLCLTLQ